MYPEFYFKDFYYYYVRLEPDRNLNQNFPFECLSKQPFNRRPVLNLSRVGWPKAPWTLTAGLRFSNVMEIDISVPKAAATSANKIPTNTRYLRRAKSGLRPMTAQGRRAVWAHINTSLLGFRLQLDLKGSWLKTL